MPSKVPSKKKPIGQVLLERGIINENQLATALNRQQSWGRRLGENLVALGFISEQQLTKVLGEIYRKPTVDVKTAPITKAALKMIPEDLCLKHHIIPVTLKVIDGKEQLVVAISDPSNLDAIDEAHFHVKYPIFEVLSTVTDIDDAIRKYYQEKGHSPATPHREITLTREREDLPEAEIVYDQKLDRQQMSEVKSLPLVGSSAERWEKMFHSLVQILVNKGMLSEEEGRRLLSL